MRACCFFEPRPPPYRLNKDKIENCIAETTERQDELLTANNAKYTYNYKIKNRINMVLP